MGSSGGGPAPMSMAERLAIMREEEAQARRAREEERAAKLQDDLLQSAIEAGEKAKAATEATLSLKAQQAADAANAAVAAKLSKDSTETSLKIKKKNYDEDEE